MRMRMMMIMWLTMALMLWRMAWPEVSCIVQTRDGVPVDSVKVWTPLGVFLNMPGYTDSTGFFNVTSGASSGATVTFWVELEGYVFEPDTVAVNVDTLVYITAIRPMVWGWLGDTNTAASRGIEGSYVLLSNGTEVDTAWPSEEGQFAIEVDYGWTGTLTPVTPNDPEYMFFPETIMLTDVQDDVTTDVIFIAEKATVDVTPTVVRRHQMVTRSASFDLMGRVVADPRAQMSNIRFIRR